MGCPRGSAICSYWSERGGGCYKQGTFMRQPEKNGWTMELREQLCPTYVCSSPGVSQLRICLGGLILHHQQTSPGQKISGRPLLAGQPFPWTTSLRNPALFMWVIVWTSSCTYTGEDLHTHGTKWHRLVPWVHVSAWTLSVLCRTAAYWTVKPQACSWSEQLLFGWFQEWKSRSSC